MKLSNRIITVDRSPIFVGKDALSSLDHFLLSIQTGKHHMVRTDQQESAHHSGNNLFILTDANTRKFCLPVLMEKSLLLAKAPILEIPAGEDSKSLANTEILWNELLAAGAGRNTVLINLGGGVVSDLGGFVAAGYKRGIHYINIPTSLMGQADAAIGGKTAINMGHIKNQVGFFHAAKAVFIYPGFMKTLPVEHLRSGFAEIIKGALVGDGKLWRRIHRNPVDILLKQPVESGVWLKLITDAVKFKNRVVMQDYREQKIRKVLNFGHTIGHALEAFYQTGSGNRLLHGEAVAAGMICAVFLSHRKAGLPLADFEAIKTYLADGFHSVQVDVSDQPAILKLMTHDKKQHNGRNQFTLISRPGTPVINVSCERDEIMEALEFLTGCRNRDRIAGEVN